MIDKSIRIAALAQMVQGQVRGDGEGIVESFSSLEDAGKNEITFLAEKKRGDLLKDSLAGAIIVPPGLDNDHGKTLIEVKNPYLAAAIVHNYFLEKPFVAKGIHPRAFVGDHCSLGSSITVGPMAVLGDRVRIGERVNIGAGAVIGDGVVIGDDTTVHANVTIYRECIIGNRVAIHSGTVIGADGYGYANNERGEHVKRPQVGIVRIDDDVEIGANSCVDRASYGETWIKSGVKIDNMVQVAHNVVVGENSLLVAQVGIAGSTTLGRNVVLGGQAACAGHLNIGDRVMVAARGGLHSDQPEGAVLGGAPAIPAGQWAKCCAVYNKLPELKSMVRKNNKAIAALTGQSEKS